MQETQSKGLLFGTIGAVLIVFGLLTWGLMKLPSDTAPKANGSLSFNDENAPIFGKADSKVVVQIYSDLQCPACRAAEPGLQAAIEKYKDRVKFVWNDFPLMTIHKNARNAANAARCAQAQGKFKEYTDTLFLNQMAWSGVSNPTETFKGYAKDASLDEGAFASCYEKKEHDAKVMADYNEGIANNVGSTPTFIVNNVLSNARTLDQWSAVLEKALADSSTN